MPEDIKDLNSRWPGHPRYKINRPVEDNVIEVILQKLEMILFTNKKECFGDIDLGCDLEYYLWQTRVPGTVIENDIREQVTKYIPEMDAIGYEMRVELYQGDEREQMTVFFTINGYNIDYAFE